MSKTIVVLGGSMAGLNIVHRLLKYTLPHESDFKVILVSKNSHFYWNCASPRGVIPGLIPDEEYIQAIAPGLDKYPLESNEFIVGSATGVDKTSRQVTVSTADGTRQVKYDYLVIATGARCTEDTLPWKANNTYEELIESIHRTQENIKQAKHIVVAGAGATGVELCGELKFEYEDKQVLLLCADEKLVGGDSCHASMEKGLKSMHVEIKKSARVEGTKTLDNGKTEITLGNDEKITTDYYVATMGMVPNTEFLPAEWLTDRKYLNVDDNFQVVGEKGVWSLGDAVSRPRASFPETEAQGGAVHKNIEAVLKGKNQSRVKGLPADVFVCSMGRSRGVGRIGWVPAPSLAIWAIKGRTLGRERTSKYVDGSAF
ncbi:Apoptosis-inducing factor-like protein [Emericellopsis cladophorae]|uniref:Apoptosis-inducing factor-like protein n=1 Tax=Emericellopsis cladophorae TaxID=2686198 RepID=A0A9P9Y848_9HYPO|nr:Apoptosis-inducing factor-like protein [Emericellopsis cladophorae]KAI6785292.1 Apoptosis-inducing factor-like protein [Emericellopsis cladophorae]